MNYLQLRAPEYVVRYMEKKFSTSDGAVLLPQYSLVWYAAVNSAQPRPFHENPVQGNLLIGIRERATNKDLRYCNWLGEKRLRYIERLLREQFDMDLLEYMERRHYRDGVDYEVAAREFWEEYELEGLITEDALLKKHIRWKHKRKAYRKGGEQLTVDI